MTNTDDYRRRLEALRLNSTPMPAPQARDEAPRPTTPSTAASGAKATRRDQRRSGLTARMQQAQANRRAQTTDGIRRADMIGAPPDTGRLAYDERSGWPPN